MRLLIVEDEEDLANALAQGLRQEGYAVDLALDGQEGWELANVNIYDVPRHLAFSSLPSAVASVHTGLRALHCAPQRK
jgi:response regulator RpfG family c-di-GMP phosphodiesterase